jgi:hypothetical protein
MGKKYPVRTPGTWLAGAQQTKIFIKWHQIRELKQTIHHRTAY